MRMDPSVFTTGGTIGAAQSENSIGSMIPLLARRSISAFTFLLETRLQFSVYKIQVELYHLHESCWLCSWLAQDYPEKQFYVCLGPSVAM